MQLVQAQEADRPTCCAEPAVNVRVSVSEAAAAPLPCSAGKPVPVLAAEWAVTDRVTPPACVGPCSSASAASSRLHHLAVSL